MIPVMAALSTVSCGGRRELPKSPGFMLHCLQLSSWLRLRVWFSCWNRGEVNGGD